MEKAAAKLFVTYTGVESGMSESAMRILTGMPTSYISSKSIKDKGGGGDIKVWDLIMKGTVDNYPMTTGTSNSAPTYLMPSHAYTILRGKQLINPDGSNGPKLIEIRNPHGNSRYINRGPWSPFIKPNKWTEDFKK
jgi:hypothetical protein